MLAAIRTFALGAALLATGCTSLPYGGAKRVVEPMAGAGPSLTGLRGLSPGQPLRLLVVHGMCTQGVTWKDKWVVRLNAAFGSPGAELPKETVGGIETHRYGYTHDGRRVEATLVIWSPVFAQAKDALDFDRPPGFDYERAEFNAKGKEKLVNDCLSDAVIYNGSRQPGTAGAAVRRDMPGVVCRFYGGAWSGEACTGGDPSTDAAIITESLGSKITFDAIEALKPADAKAGAALITAFERTAAIYMLANQLPLLRLAEAAEPGNKALAPQAAEPGLDLLGPPLPERDKGARGQAKRLQIVAFTDPNDLLSYRLTHDAIGQSPDRVTLFNVIVSNDKTWFDKAENPWTAHTGYWDNPSVTDLILNGAS